MFVTLLQISKRLSHHLACKICKKRLVVELHLSSGVPRNFVRGGSTNSVEVRG